MQGDDALNNMDGFDFETTWLAVIEGESLNSVPDEDGYPILEALDAGQQADAQGIELSEPPGVTVEGENVTFDNVTVDGGDDD